ncbi:MAG: hypothetical protein A3F68_09055 [Acidobacteria bacterium RIFCSPLOWO2_12_FULL_54_10]|nr:MAG: hypothetical protein A3F68_09055 [Acidobacteria bacterium RIFCSPLOWO2_12_FULL_54_10]
MHSTPIAAQIPKSANTQTTNVEIQKSLEMITKVYHLLATQFADPIDPQTTIYQGAIRGALASLDPFSVFLDADQFGGLKDQQRGVQQGFGAVLSIQSGQVLVLQALPETPFSRAGLGPGDRILRINGQRIANLNLQELLQVLQDAKKGKASLSVLRSGKVVAEDFELNPAELESSAVDRVFLLEPGIGYLHISGMEQATSQEIRSALESWQANKKLTGIILDLRDNPGGSLDAAVDIAGLFLPKGSLVVSLRGRSIPGQEYRVSSDPAFPVVPIVVVINERSASASEILAAALQEFDRAWILGQPSFGKGVAESVLPLSEGTALVLTTARHFTPKGRSVQRPLPDTALAGILKNEVHGVLSERGRSLSSSGGVHPDQIASSWQLSDWAVWLDQSTAYINFAQKCLERIGKVAQDFAADDRIMSDFLQYLTEADVRVPPLDWKSNQGYLKMRIEMEIFNLVYGMERGNRAEVEADPQVIIAREAITEMPQLLP